MELRNIRAQQQKVVQLANGSLNHGIINENVTQTTTALQVCSYYINKSFWESILNLFYLFGDKCYQSCHISSLAWV